MCGREFLGRLREAGLSVESYKDHFPQRTPDEDWLSIVGEHGWTTLTRDRRIRSRSRETDALMRAGARCFLLIAHKDEDRQPIKLREMADVFVRSLNEVYGFLKRHPGPFIAKIYCNPLHTDPERVSMWLTHSQWQERRGNL